MNDQTKKSCFAEISHLICDCDKKVNINDISNNWNLSFRDSESVLLEWLKVQKDRVLAKEYIVRGVDKSERCFISVVPERRLASLEKHFAKFCSSLYSLELPSESNRLGIVELSKTNHIRLPLQGEIRACKVLPINIASVQSDAKNVKAEASTPVAKKNPMSTMFAAKPATKSEEKSKPHSDKTDSEPTVKTETKTPKKESPKKKGAVKAPTALTGKSSISSFFSAQPTAAKSSESKAISTTKEAANGIEKKETLAKAVPLKKEQSPKEKLSKKHTNDIEKKLTKAKAVPFKKAESPKENSPKNIIEKTPTKKGSNEKKKEKEKEDKNANKRSFAEIEDSDDEVIMGTPQDTKKSRRAVESKKKQKTPVNNKHSRIRQIVDSSDSDEEVTETRPASPTPSPAKESVNETPNIDINRRRKAKRTVTKTYQDEEGYLITAKEIEEYSCSDEDDAVVEVAKTVKNNPIKSDPVKRNAPTTSNSVEKEKTPKKAKKIIQPKAGTKQGSILNFFNKK